MGLCAALIWTLAFESPILILEKAIFNRKPRQKQQSNELNNNNLVSNSKEDLIKQYDNNSKQGTAEINEDNNNVDVITDKNKILV